MSNEKLLVRRIHVFLNEKVGKLHAIRTFEPEQEIELDEDILLSHFGDNDFSKDKGAIYVEGFKCQEDMWAFDEYCTEPSLYLEEVGDEIPEMETDYFFFDNLCPVKKLEKLQEKYNELKWRMEGLEK